jgi:uncharacterized protein (TIGR03435 family)
MVWSSVAALAPPAFDAASVKRIAGPSGGVRQEVTPTSLSLRGVPLGYCIRWAYGLRPYQTYQTAGPDWVDPPHAQFYDIVAKAGGPVTVEQLRLMLQTLLADRFRLAVHREKKNLAGYALTVGKNGPKFIPSGKAEDQGQAKPRGVLVFDCEGFSMARLAEFLGTITWLPSEAIPILDETGLTGTFDFTLDLAKHREYDGSGAPVLDERGHIDMQRVVMSTLPDIGLKLEAKRAPVDVLVIDHVEKEPAGN